MAQQRYGQYEHAVRYDKIIIGAGLYGLYAAAFCGERNQHVLVLEYDEAPFRRATYINQARVHMGYHYPRSLTTAVKSAGYFRRFVEDFGFAFMINLNRSMPRQRNFPGPAQGSLKIFVRRHRSGVRKRPFPSILNRGCVTALF